MSRGRPPKPAGLKLIDGNTRKLGRRRFAEEIAAEPVPRRGFPDCPAHLTGNAAEGWRRLTESLSAMGMDAYVDAMAIQGAAELYGRAMDADVVLADKGVTMEIPVVAKGEVVGYFTKTRPEESISRRSWTLYRQYAADLAANVVSRSRLAVAKTKRPSSDIDDAIFGT